MVSVSTQNWNADSLDHVSTKSGTFLSEAQPTSKIRHARAIVVTKILKSQPDEEKSYKMESYDFCDFRFWLYEQNYIGKVPNGISRVISQELMRTRTLLVNTPTHRKATIESVHMT